MKRQVLKNDNSASAQTASRILQGTVISDKMNKTVVVMVEKTKTHNLYNKVLRMRKNYKVHDEEGVAKVGDKVLIQECAPISKTKHMKLVKVVSL